MQLHHFDRANWPAGVTVLKAPASPWGNIICRITDPSNRCPFPSVYL